MRPRVLLSTVLVVVASFACTTGQAGPDAVPGAPPSGEPGVVNLIADDTPPPDDTAVPGSGVEYGHYAPGSR